MIPLTLTSLTASALHARHGEHRVRINLHAGPYGLHTYGVHGPGYIEASCARSLDEAFDTACEIVRRRVREAERERNAA